MGSPASPRNVGAVQPPRAARLLHTRRTLSKPASSSYRRFLVLCSFTTLVAASSSRYHFVCLSRGGPSRRRALPYSRTYTLLSPPCVHISIACSTLSLAYRSLPRCMPRCIPLCRAHLGCHSLATTESVGLQRVFSTSRGEPRSLRLTARGFPGCFDCTWREADCGMRGFPSSRRRRYPQSVCFVPLARRQTSLPAPRAYFARSSRYDEGRISRSSLTELRCNGAVTVCSRSALR